MVSSQFRVSSQSEGSKVRRVCCALLSWWPTMPDSCLGQARRLATITDPPKLGPNLQMYVSRSRGVGLADRSARLIHRALAASRSVHIRGPLGTASSLKGDLQPRPAGSRVWGVALVLDALSYSSQISWILIKMDLKLSETDERCMDFIWKNLAKSQFCKISSSYEKSEDTLLDVSTRAEWRGQLRAFHYFGPNLGYLPNACLRNSSTRGIPSIG